MNLSFVGPHPELRPHIESLWVFESAAGMPLEHQSLPHFVGGRDCPTQLCSSGQKIGFIGIEFYPQGAFPFFGIPMKETANQLFEAETLFNQWGRRVRDKLLNLVAAD
jgi:hypothetical protein